jgi:hypothetical protein
VCIDVSGYLANRYAYIEIALYGKPYLAAAKDTWRLFVDRGIDALVNDQIVSMGMDGFPFSLSSMARDQH